MRSTGRKLLKKDDRGMTREEAIKIVRTATVWTDEEREALGVLIPEFSKSESKDEKIRKEIISALKFANVGGIYDEHIAYLENQKPSFRQIHDGVIWNRGLRTGIELGKQKEQKPVDLSEMMVHKEPDVAPVPTPTVADEQKPVDYEAELKKCKDNPLYFFDKYVSIKLKPMKWSEEDEEMLQSIIKDFRDGNISSIGQEQWLKSLPERFNLQPKEEQSKYDGNMDKECIKLCNTLNSIPSIDTFESCCGHLKDSYSVWFFCNDIIAISRLGRCVERNYSDGKWELLVDSTDTHPTGVFWLRSKVPFQSYDEMEESVNELCVCIQYWFNTKFDSYFNDDACK